MIEEKKRKGMDERRKKLRERVGFEGLGLKENEEEEERRRKEFWRLQNGAVSFYPKRRRFR